MEKIKWLVILPFFLFIAAASAQSVRDTSNVSYRFNSALQLYDSSKYEEAQRIFDNIITRSVFNSQTTISYIFDAKSLLKLNKYEDAKLILDNFLEEYPGSKYADEAKLTLAQIFTEQNNYQEAFDELLTIIDSSNTPFYINYSKSSAEKIAINFLSVDRLKTVYDSLAGNKSKPFVRLILGKLYLQKDNLKEAENSFSNILKQFSESEEKAEAATLYNKTVAENILSGSPVIAVLLPLNGNPNGEDYKTIADILDGIKFAFSEYNNQSEKKVGLIIENTNRSREQIEKIKSELVKLPALKAVIGPVFSDEVRETLEAFKKTGIPVISPTATDDSLAINYPDFFQANPSFLIRGKILAEYIYYVENKRNMAVLNSIDNYSSNIAESFIKEFEILGGKIITNKTYNSDSLSFDDQVAQIAADSLKLDGVFIPLFNKNVVPYLLSQFVKYNFDLPLYGNQDWFLAKGYETYPALSNKLTFSSDYFLDYSDTSFISFSKRFTACTNKEVSRFVLYGYDAAEFLLTHVKDFNESCNRIKEELESGSIYNGYHNRISFDSGRVNKFMNILRYKDGRFELVDKFKLSK